MSFSMLVAAHPSEALATFFCLLWLSSELLAQIPQVRANSVFQLVYPRLARVGRAAAGRLLAPLLGKGGNDEGSL